jgi:group II intron reverse transcriptase/maturase
VLNEARSRRLVVSLQAPGKVQKLQQALHAKAKGSPGFRFYALYDKVYREDVLAHAWRLARSNGGKPGVDGEDFEAIAAYGVERWLGELAQALREKRYRASPVRRVYIPKPNGRQRPLGIPTVRDRVVQTAAVLVLAPIFEADLQPEQYAYREGRGAHDAVRHVHKLLNTGYTEVIDADLSGYFDSIPHAELMQCVARRVSDRHVLALIKQWLVAPVEEDDGRGRRKRTTRAKDSARGIPQGAPISPLLSNLYMRRFVLGWKTLGLEARLQARIVNYADDFVLCCRGTATAAMEAMRRMMEALKLTVNEEKTRHCRIPQEHFDFLGYTFGRCYSTQTGRAYIGTRPSRKSIRRVCRTLSEVTARRRLIWDAEAEVARLNRILVGWANYFSLGPVSKAYRAIDAHASERLRRWLCKKHKLAGRGTARFPDEHLYDVLGLQRLTLRTRNLPWAKA